MKKYLYLIAICVAVNCGEKPPSGEVPTFTTARKSLNSTSRHNILNPDFVAIYDTTLVVYEAGLDSNFIHLISLNSFHKKNHFGRRGDGPGEYSTSLKKPINVAGNTELSIYDWPKKRLYGYSLPADSILKITQNYLLPPDFIIGQRAVYLDDNSALVTGGGIQNGVAGIVNTQTDEIKYIDPYGSLASAFDMRERERIFRSEATINYEKQLIAMAVSLFPEIIIANFDGEIISRTKISEYDFDKIARQDEDEVMIQFYGIGSSPDYIYAVRAGHNYAQLENYIYNDSYGENLSVVYVFDWEGTLVKKITLDQKFHPFITVDAQNNRIFSIDRFSANDVDVVYFESDEIR